MKEIKCLQVCLPYPKSHCQQNNIKTEGIKNIFV